MPLGPRPEPPPVPRKEPVRTFHRTAVSSQASNVPPPPPPKDLTRPVSSRLRGPRPISSISPVRPYKTALPYPMATTADDLPDSPSTASSFELDPVSSQDLTFLSMPEPDPAPAYPGANGIIDHDLHSARLVSQNASIPVPVAPVLFPEPDSYGHSDYDQLYFANDPRMQSFNKEKHTRSIFQWGIPAELLPPTPVPVDAMTGLQVSTGGQYTMSLDLPEIPPMDPVRSTFSAEQLTVADFQAIKEVWSLSAIAQWLYQLMINVDADFTAEAVQQALTKLFLYRIAVLEWVRAEASARDVIRSLTHQGFITTQSVDGLVILNTACSPVSGVLTLFCGDGCYSPTVTTSTTSPMHSCYASRCIREPRQLPTLTGNAADPFSVIEMNWRKFWSLNEADVGDVDPKLVKLQFAIHELIMSEELYVRDLEIYLDVYGEIELMEGLAIMSKQKEFSTRVFERIRAIVSVNQKLLHKMRERQRQQGPYIQSLADVLIAWARSPHTFKAYTAYADDYLWTDNHLRHELSHNARLQKWMEERSKDPRLTGRPHSFFFLRVLPRVARYQLLLHAVQKYMPEQSSETEMVAEAITATTVLTQACDDHVAKQKHLLDVQNLKAHIVFKSSSVTADLKLGDKRRKLIRRGEMVRRGDLKVEWVPTHVMLLDNFLVLSKTREGMNGTAFYVTKAPIPLDLLVLQSYNEESVVKVTSRLTITRHGSEDADQAIDTGDEDRPALFPIRITHLGTGGQQYLLFVRTRPERDAWAKAIVDAKQSRAQLAFARSAEPFRIEMMSDSFAYPEADTPVLPVPIANTPLQRAVGNPEQLEPGRVIFRRRVNWLVTIGSVHFLGSDFGLWIFIDEQWRKVLTNPQRVARIEILESMNVLFVLDGDHNLIWYPLDQLIARALGDTRHPVGTRLNRQRKVLDFQVAYHKGRVVMAYLQQGGTVKVVEPIRSRGLVPMRELERAGLTSTASIIDSFREIDRLQVNSDTTRITMFLKSLILHAGKSFEWITLDSKHPVRIPTGTTSMVSKESQRWGRPLAVFKVDSARLLLCYEACCFMCDMTGRMSIQPTTWFLDKSVDVAYQSPYLVIFSQSREMIEIRYVDEFPGRLVQLITGKDIKLLSGSDDTIRIRLAHPWLPGRQLVVQLVGNDVVLDNESTWHSSST